MKVEITGMTLYHHQTGCRCELTHRDTIGAQRLVCDGASSNEAIAGAFSLLLRGRLQPVRVSVFDGNEPGVSRTFFVEPCSDIEVRVVNGVPSICGVSSIPATKTECVEGGRE